MINRRVLLSSLALLPTLWPWTAAAQQTKRVGSRAFSFAVYGDSRSMMYLPYKAEQEAEARKLMVEMFDLVLPEKVSEEVVQKYVKLIYDPTTKELVQSDHLAAEFFGLPALPTSALTGEGIPALRERILALATGGAAAEPGLLTNIRHQQAIAAARAGLADAARANESAIPHEMILLDLYRALWALDSLTGQTTPDDVLNMIFSTFCIGK